MTGSLETSILNEMHGGNWMDRERHKLFINSRKLAASAVNLLGNITFFAGKFSMTG